MLTAKYAQLLKMQETSLLLQKENEPEQKKSQQAPWPPACARPNTWGLGGPSSSGRRVLLVCGRVWGWKCSGSLPPPPLYREEMMTRTPWPSALGGTRLAHHFLVSARTRAGPRLSNDGSLRDQGVITRLLLVLGSVRDAKCCRSSG